MMRSDAASRMLAIAVFVVFAVAAFVKSWLLHDETLSARGGDGEREAVLAALYLGAAVVALVGLVVMKNRKLKAPRSEPAMRTLAVIALSGLTFWLVDASQKTPLNEGNYGPRSIMLLAFGAVALAGALAAALYPTKRSADQSSGRTGSLA